jgi:carbamoyl-phosphate synthase large subunit
MRRGPVLLFLCGGRRVTLLQYFRAALEPAGGRILVTDTEPWSASSHIADLAYRVAPCADAAQFGDDVARICANEEVSAVLPLTCSAVAAIPTLRARTPVRIIGGDAEAIATATDKRLASAYFYRLGIPTPAVFDNPSPLDLPLFRRYRHGEGSRGALPILAAAELARAQGENGQIFTRYLEGSEYSVDCYKDLQGRIRAIMPRLRLRVRAGEVEKAVIRREHALIELVRRAIDGLRFVGPATVQAIHADGIFHLTEINLRYGGGVTLSIAAGMDSPGWLVTELMGRAPEPVRLHWHLAMCRHDRDIYFELPDDEA